VHLTADGVPVVHHDPELGAGPLAGRAIVDLTHDALGRHRLAPGWACRRSPTCSTLAAGRATVYVEVKARGAEAAVAAALAGRGADAPVHSFDHRVSRRVRALAPDTPVGVLSTSYLLDTVGAMRAAGARDLWQHWTMVDAALVDAVHASGGRVVVWTVNDLAAAVALAELGVDGICTDVAGTMRSAFPRGPS
jgi:glycerophosphoryl diester phosphodiesterase